MIEQLKIQNFQSHTATKLDFHPGVNAIIGSSDSGKSAIIRCLRWIVQNRPSGDSFIHNEKEHAKACLKINNHGIIRYKGKENYYKLDQDKFDAIGKDVPIEIQKAINFSKINFQFQMDGHFLLHLSPGQLAKELNEIADIDCIDKSMKKIEQRRRSTTQEINNLEKQIKIKKDKLLDYIYIAEFEKQVLSLQKKETVLENENIKTQEISNCVAKMGKIICAIGQYKQYEKNDLARIELLQEQVLQIFQTEERLSAKQEIVSKRCEAENLLKAKSMYTTEILQHISKLENELDIIDADTIDINGIALVCTDIQVFKNKIEKHTSILEKKEKKYHELMPDVCPLCGK